MKTLAALGILWTAGLITVVTETFTHLIVGRSPARAFREFLLGSALFCATAFGWGVACWFGLDWSGYSYQPREFIELLGLAHFPLLVYPLTIFPTLGYRLEQLLRLAVYGILVLLLTWSGEAPLATVAAVAFPGWIAHFLLLEFRLARQAQES